LLPRSDAARYELLCELGIAQYSAGATDASTATFQAAIEGSEAIALRRIQLRARIEAAYGRLLTEPEGAAQDLLEVAENAIPTFEAIGDDRSLARAWLLIGYVRGGIHGNHAAWEEAEERALVHYRRTAFPTATCLGQIAGALYWGPTKVSDGIGRCGELLTDETIGHAGRAMIMPYLGGLHAQAGDTGQARALLDEAEAIYEDLGAASAVVHCGTVRADVELLAEDHAAAERTLREQCEQLELMHDRAHLAVRAAKLAETLYRQGRLDEAQQWAEVSRSNAASDDRSVQLVLGPVDAKLAATRGATHEGRALAEDAVRLAEGTDGLNHIAATKIAFAEVLRMSELHSDAERSMEEAIELYERKGNVAGAALARRALALGVPA
jgi:tetratricopeptide (TPR) repeat protein